MTTRTLMILSLLLSPLTASAAGAKKLPEYDLSTPDETLKSAKKWGFKVESKPRAYPEKVAIGYFQVRYHFKETTGSGKGINRKSTTVTTLRFDDAEYEQLTNQLYAQLKARLEAEGFDVADRQAVLDSAAYQAIEQEADVKGNEKRVRYSPTGMKNLPTFSGRPRNPGALAPINSELGTGAVVAAFVNIGLCTVEATKKTGMRYGVFPCIKGDLTMPGFNITWVGEPKSGKSKPSWTSRLYKELREYDYNKKDALTYDMALIPSLAGANFSRRKGFWKSGWDVDTDEQAFIAGSGAIYDDALTLAFEMWDSKNGKSREAAGMKRTPVKDAVPEEGFEPAAAEPAEPEVVVEPIGPMTGTVRCYFDTKDQATLLRRGVDAEKGRIIEDVVTFAEGQANFRAATEWTVTDSTAVLREAGDFWAGTATFDGDPWTATSWKVNLTMKNTMIVDADYRMDGDAMVSKTVMTINGAEAGKVDGRLELIDEAACLEKLSAVAIPSSIRE